MAYHISDIYNEYCNSIYGFYDERIMEFNDYGSKLMPCFEPHERRKIVVREVTGSNIVNLDAEQDQVLYDINVWSTNCTNIVEFELQTYVNDEYQTLTKSTLIDKHHLKKYEQLDPDVPHIKQENSEVNLKNLADDEYYHQSHNRPIAIGFPDFYKTHPVVPFLGVGSKFRIKSVDNDNNKTMININDFTYSYVVTYKVCNVAQDFIEYVKKAMSQSDYYQELNNRGTLLYVNGKATCALFRSKKTSNKDEGEGEGPKIEEVDDVESST